MVAVKDTAPEPVTARVRVTEQAPAMAEAGRARAPVHKAAGRDADPGSRLLQWLKAGSPC